MTSYTAAFLQFFIATFIINCINTANPYKTLYFEQFVDHFNYENSQTFSQRYLLDDEFYRKSDTLFFYTGNEGDIEMFYDNTGFLFELADKMSALVVFAEHRYYGKSLPFGNETFKKENMGFLSAEQALADYAVLIENLKSQFNIKKTIAFGGSYGGMLSAWMRFKYPNIIDGALAASAPIYMVADVIDSKRFFGKVTEDFKAYNSHCPDAVRDGFHRIYNLANHHGDEGLKEITKSMNLCKTLTADKVDHLVGWVRNSYTSIAMVDYPYPASFLADLPAYPVNAACDIILKAEDVLSGLANSAGLLYNGTKGTLSCYDIEMEFIQCADPTGCGLGDDSMAWDYQACTEMTLRCDTNNVTDMFPPMKYDVEEYCQEKWGVKYRPGWMNAQYWGKEISSATNIIFSNGDLDPWSVGGVNESSQDSVYPFLVVGGAHHLDLRSSNPKDPQSVVDIREKETQIIANWIK